MGEAWSRASERPAPSIEVRRSVGPRMGYLDRRRSRLRASPRRGRPSCSSRRSRQRRTRRHLRSHPCSSLLRFHRRLWSPRCPSRVRRICSRRTNWPGPAPPSPKACSWGRHVHRMCLTPLQNRRLARPTNERAVGAADVQPQGRFDRVDAPSDVLRALARSSGRDASR